MILPTVERRQNANRFVWRIHVEPVDRPANGEMPHARQDVVMALPATV